jgi:hypothetical protein
VHHEELVPLGPQIAADDIGLPSVVLRDENMSAHGTDYKSQLGTDGNYEPAALTGSRQLSGSLPTMQTSDRSLLPAGSTEHAALVENRYRRVPVYVAVGLVLVLAVGVGVTWWSGPDSGSDRTVKTSTAVETATVTRNDVSTGSSMPGTLGYGATRKITASQDGLITWLPRSGTTISRGNAVYRVNDRPIPLFYGKMPLFRDLRVRGAVGRDVRVVVDNLRALGYSVGAQPAPGTVLTRSVPVAAAAPTTATSSGSTGSTAAKEPDATAGKGRSEGPPLMENRPGTKISKRTVHKGESVLTAAVIAAVKSWQRDLELPATGRLGPGSVVVFPKAFRVSALSAYVGDRADGELLSATSTSKVLTVHADEDEAASIERGDRATVALSDSSTTTARVVSVSTALQTEEGGDESSPKLDITLVLDHPAKLKRVDSADLQVSFAVETHKHVLTVPVGALLALGEGGYALQPVSGDLIAVETGIFAKGMVEVSGAGVTEGLSVVTTA